MTFYWFSSKRWRLLRQNLESASLKDIYPLLHATPHVETSFVWSLSCTVSPLPHARYLHLLVILLKYYTSLSWSSDPPKSHLIKSNAQSLSLSLSQLLSLRYHSHQCALSLSYFNSSFFFFFFFLLFWILISFAAIKIGNHFPFPILLIWISRRFYLQCFLFIYYY